MIGVRKRIPLVLAALLPSLALADHDYRYARVLSAEPIYETVSYSVPVEECRDETVAYHDNRSYPARRSATAPIVGAIIGGALGNAVGHKKRNKQVGAVVGAVLGGSIGADIGRRNSRYGEPRYVTREACSVVHEQRREERLAGYLVTYRYGGETYTTEMDRDPGDSLPVRVRVTPVG